MSHVLRSQLLRTVLVLVACAIFTLGAFAQSTVDGAIAGTVTDQTKAVVPAAKVTIRNIETNATFTATTDDQGKFRVTKLRPGTYAITVEAANFAVRTDKAVVEVGVVTSVEPVLGVAGTTENLEITAEAPAINTIQQDFSANINQTSINELPINGRRWSNFALLAPGATPDGSFGLISFRGISGLLNNSTVDGGDNNQAFFSEERGRTRASYVVSQASVREFQVNTSNFSAEYGRAAGAVVNSVTKSGTNSLHGSAFYYLRDNRFGATNPFWFQPTKQSDGTYTLEPIKPDDRRHQFGGTIGGPIVKDKLFFFFSYDQQKRNYPSLATPGNPTAFFAAPTAAEIASLRTAMGIASTDAEGDAKARAAWDSALGFLNSDMGIVPRKGDQHITFPKLDWTINSRNNLAVSWNRMRWNAPAGVQSQPVVNRGIASYGDDFVKVDTVIARLNSTLSNTVLNEIRFQWGRDFEYQQSQPASAAEVAFMNAAAQAHPDLFTFAKGGRFPSVSIASSSGITIGKPNFLERASYPDEVRHQLADTMTVAKGKHLLKFGFDVNQVRDKMDNLYREGGDYSYSNVAAFVKDYTTAINADMTPTRSYTSFNQGFGTALLGFKTHDINLFIQDDFRVLPRLTLNMGVRYEYQLLPKARYANPALPMTASLPSDENNWGPRFGFALDVFGTGKTAVRGGYGIYYGRIINSTIANAITNTGINTGQTQIEWRGSNYPADSPYLPGVGQFKSTTSSKPDVVFFGADTQAPQIHQADLIIEQEIAKNTVVSATYLLSMGRHLPNFIDTNLKPATRMTSTPFRGGPLDGMTLQTPLYTERYNTSYGRLTQITSNVNSNYNALVLQFNRRMTGGLQFQTNYTWSHSLDYGQLSQTFTTGNAVFDALHPELEYGHSNFDIRHKFVASAIWSPEFFKNSGGFVKAVLDGWTISPIVNIMSGRPYTETVSGSVSLPTSNPRSDLFTAGGGINGSGGFNRIGSLIGRNSFRYPGTELVDLRLSKRVAITEQHKVEFLAEAFNLFNHVNYTYVPNRMYSYNQVKDSAGNITDRYLSYDKTFGIPTEAGNTNFRERQIQFAVRYEF